MFLNLIFCWYLSAKSPKLNSSILKITYATNSLLFKTWKTMFNLFFFLEIKKWWIISHFKFATYEDPASPFVKKNQTLYFLLISNSSSSETSLKSYFSSSLLWKSFLYPCDMTSESMAYAKSFLVHFLKQRYVIIFD